MGNVIVKVYPSPSVALLAFDWPDGIARNDFLGFAIERIPGFNGATRSWLPNRISFDGPAPDGSDFPSDQAPIQKFMWWDARINDADHGSKLTYTVTPALGTPGNISLLDSASVSILVTLPQNVEDGIGTWFNRAVVSSQAFSKQFLPMSSDKLDPALTWLANGLEKVVPSFIQNESLVGGAIYHLTDNRWIIPAFSSYQGDSSMVYNDTSKDHANDPAVSTLESATRKFYPRTRANIMHNKFIVKQSGGNPSDLLMGSANFTTEGLTTQANLLHTFQSPDLAELYWAREKMLEQDPPLGKTAQDSGWSDPVKIGSAAVSAIFSPEPKDSSDSIDRIVNRVKAATDSILFCIFDPTDRSLREAIFAQADNGKMMFGLVNTIPSQEPTAPRPNAETQAKVEIYHRSRSNRDVYSHSLYAKNDAPQGFWWEVSSLPGDAAQFPVYIHHKFVVVDGETDHPTIYTGSANMSNNSVHKNDENLLEITGSTKLASLYLAEFFRLYEHYRARAQWQRRANGENTYQLAPDSKWAHNHYTTGTPEYKSRIDMVA